MIQSVSIPHSTPNGAILQTMSFEASAAHDINSVVLRDTLSIWTAACRSRPLPARKDIDPIDLPPNLLPHIMLIDVIHEAEIRLRWRLIGTALTRLVERDMTGHWWHDIYEPKVLAKMMTGLDVLFKERRPIRSIGTAPLEGKKHLRLETVTMPLSDNGQDINMLFAASEYRMNKLD